MVCELALRCPHQPVGEERKEGGSARGRRRQPAFLQQVAVEPGERHVDQRTHHRYLRSREPVSWYVCYRLSYAEVSEWLAEPRIVVDQSTIYRWLERFLPVFGDVARQYGKPVSAGW